MSTQTVTIPGLNAGSALVGTEPFETVQSSASVKTTASAIKTYVLTGGVASGTFTSQDGKTITVTNGLITSIV